MVVSIKIGSKSLLITGELKSLYDSNNWEQPNWNRSTMRNWKRQRATQFKGAGRISIRNLELVEE